MKRAELHRRTPLRASASLHRSSGLNPVSRKRQRDDVPLSVRRAVKTRSHGLCECGCGQLAEHIHHRKLRSQGGRHEPVNLLHLTFACHDAVHANPERSYALGLMVRSWADPEDVPVISVGAA